MPTFKKTDRNKIKRKPKRGTYNKSTVYDIIDQGLICHVGFVQAKQPFVIPTIYASASRLLAHIKSRHPICITITILDGLVLARSAFHHSVNYRSVVLFGKGEAIEPDEKKLEALELITERIMPGRWRDVRKPNRKERNATAVVRIPIEDASAKIRAGGPVDESKDYDLPIWAGVLPIEQHVCAAQSDPKLRADMSVPEYVASSRKGILFV